jgi:hypothetical protein
MSNQDAERDEIKDETHELQDDESDIEEEEEEEEEEKDIDFEDEDEDESEKENSDPQPDNGQLTDNYPFFSSWRQSQRQRVTGLIDEFISIILF